MNLSPRNQDAVTETNPWDESTLEIDATETDENISRMRDHTRDVIKMTVHTTAIPHAQITGIEIFIAMKNLVKTTEDAPRLPVARTARVDITPITSTRATRGRVRAPAALNPPSRKSREFECPLLQELLPVAHAPQVTMKRIITSGLNSL
jgi:hypothetical protein